MASTQHLTFMGLREDLMTGALYVLEYRREAVKEQGVGENFFDHMKMLKLIHQCNCNDGWTTSDNLAAQDVQVPSTTILVKFQMLQILSIFILVSDYTISFNKILPSWHAFFTISRTTKEP